MSRGFNLLIAPDAATPLRRERPEMQDPSVHRFELEVQCETVDQAWHATLSTRDGRHRLEFDSLAALMRTLAQLTLRPPIGADGAGLF